MKVLLIAHKNPFPPNDGGSMGIYTMINGLLLNDVQLDVLLMNPKKLYKPLDKSQVPSQINNIQAIDINTDIQVFQAMVNLFQKESYFVSRFYNKKFEQVLQEYLNKNSYDIIQLESLYSALYIPQIRRYSAAKIILSAHNIEYRIWQRVAEHEAHFLKKWYLQMQTKRLKKFEDHILQSVDGVTCVSDIDKQYIESVSPNTPVVVTPNGLDIHQFHLTSLEEQYLYTIFFLGSLDWIPNQQGIVWFLDKVWPLIIKKNPQIHLIIAGKNIPEWLMNRREKNVEYRSNIPDTKELYHRYAITIVPLLAGSGIRVRIIEGMAYGKCIVSTRIGAEGLPCEHQKDIMIADTPEDFAETILQLVQNPSFVKQIQTEARKTAEKYYDCKKVYLPLMNLYDQLKEKSARSKAYYINNH